MLGSRNVLGERVSEGGGGGRGVRGGGGRGGEGGGLGRHQEP